MLAYSKTSPRSLVLCIHNTYVEDLELSQKVGASHVSILILQIYIFFDSGDHRRQLCEGS